MQRDWSCPFVLWRDLLRRFCRISLSITMRSSVASRMPAAMGNLATFLAESRHFFDQLLACGHSVAEPHKKDHLLHNLQPVTHSFPTDVRTIFNTTASLQAIISPLIAFAPPLSALSVVNTWWPNPRPPASCMSPKVMPLCRPRCSMQPLPRPRIMFVVPLPPFQTGTGNTINRYQSANPNDPRVAVVSMPTMYVPLPRAFIVTQKGMEHPTVNF